jgi:hypothetical protein
MGVAEVVFCLLARMARGIKMVEGGITMKRVRSHQAIMFAISLAAGTIFSGGDVTVGLIAAIILVSVSA